MWHKLQDFVVGVADSTSDITTVENMYTLCTQGHYNGTVNLTCDQPHKSGRYLVIKMPFNQGPLELCEVGVYEGHEGKLSL